MNKKVFNLMTCSTSVEDRTGLSIRFDVNKPRLTASARLYKIIGARVNLNQDLDSPKDWYIEPTEDKYGFTVRELSHKRVIGNALIARTMIESIGMTENFTCYVSPEITEGLGYAILTKGAK
jgi:hypothetical protein